jgi:hypothetical protein
MDKISASTINLYIFICSWMCGVDRAASFILGERQGGVNIFFGTSTPDQGDRATLVRDGDRGSAIAKSSHDPSAVAKQAEILVRERSEIYASSGRRGGDKLERRGEWDAKVDVPPH